MTALALLWFAVLIAAVFTTGMSFAWWLRRVERRQQQEPDADSLTVRVALDTSGFDKAMRSVMHATERAEKRLRGAR